MTNGNGTPPEAELPPQLNVLAQYTKDLSFENPNAPAIYQSQQAPEINVQFDIGSQQVADEVHEVTLKVEIRADNAGAVMFNFELAYAGVFRIATCRQTRCNRSCSAKALGCSTRWGSAYATWSGCGCWKARVSPTCTTGCGSRSRDLPFNCGQPLTRFGLAADPPLPDGERKRGARRAIQILLPVGEKVARSAGRGEGPDSCGCSDARLED